MVRPTHCIESFSDKGGQTVSAIEQRQRMCKSNKCMDEKSFRLKENIYKQLNDSYLRVRLLWQLASGR
jgi:hypothetical protein